jgi:hypothetical protein
VKISHKQLADCQKSPRNWVSSFIRQSVDGSGPRFGFNQALSYAICNLHKTGDIEGALNELEGYLEKFVNEKKKELMRERLKEYSYWLAKSDVIPIDSNVTISLPSVGEWRLGGLVSRVDMIPTGYKAVLFEPIVPDWKLQLRMPLIQLAIAERYGRPAEEIRVGLHDLDGNVAVDFRFGDKSRSAAYTVFVELGETVIKLLPPKQ